jgi:hypothetical protein
VLSVRRPARAESLYRGRHFVAQIGRTSLWITADNRLSLQQPGGRVADEKLGIAAIHPQHFKALVASGAAGSA